MGSREWMDRESADRIGAAAERDPSSPTVIFGAVNGLRYVS